jgi:hypothetical protein
MIGLHIAVSVAFSPQCRRKHMTRNRQSPTDRGSPDFGLRREIIASIVAIGCSELLPLRAWDEVSMKCLRIYSAADGESYFDEVEIPTSSRQVHPNAAAFEVSANYAATRIRFTRIPLGARQVDWHTVPERVLTVSGSGRKRQPSRFRQQPSKASRRGWQAIGRRRARWVVRKGRERATVSAVWPSAGKSAATASGGRWTSVCDLASVASGGGLASVCDSAAAVSGGERGASSPRPKLTMVIRVAYCQTYLASARAPRSYCKTLCRDFGFQNNQRGVACHLPA